jgi:uncharacterized repeat protein (TIGR01451 family)
MTKTKKSMRLKIINFNPFSREVVMVRFLSVLAAMVCFGVVSTNAQDWGTDAGSHIIIGGDALVDSAGDGQMDIGGVQIFDPQADTSIVQAVFNLGLMGMPLNKPSGVNDTIWFVYTAANLGNGPDSIQIQTNVVTGNTFTPGGVIICKDQDLDSVFTGTDSIMGSGSVVVVLAEDGKLQTLIGVVVPGGATDGQYAQLEVNVMGNNKSGSNDLWPVDFPAYTLAPDNGDWQRDTVQVTVGMAVVAFLSSVDKPSTKPGDTLTYALQYDNDGSAPTATMPIVRQLLPKFVKYAPFSVNTATMHTGETGTTVMFSPRGDVANFMYTDSWADANADSVAGLQISFMSVVAADDTVGDGGADVAGVNGQMPDADAGQVTFKVIVK